MQTIEFNSVISDGVIPIPEKYRGSLSSSVRVIVMANDTAVPESKNFSAMKLKTKNFKFNREEANER